MVELTEQKRDHTYHAEAIALEGQLTLPFEQVIEPLVNLKLPERGGYLSQHAHSYRLGGAISLRSAYTQVGGSPSSKSAKGWSTLATAAIEGLNVLDVLTADRVVAQIATHYPEVGYIPSVTFLGSRFENLRIAGRPVRIDLKSNIFGDKPRNEASYTRDEGFRAWANKQLQQIKTHIHVTPEILSECSQEPGEAEDTGFIESSLLQNLSWDSQTPTDTTTVDFPGRCVGHVIDVPHFGRIYLAKLRIEHSDPNEKGVPRKTKFALNMIDFKLGCPIAGNVSAAVAITNGGTYP
jgi:hypothetical protein